MTAAARPRVVAGLRLLRQVGEGGEGEVWDARDATGRRRALKLIRPDALVPPAEVERRGRWLLAIEHPALVGVHRCGVLSGGGLDGWGFVEMDFVEGVALEDADADPHALARLEPLAEALDLLHAGRWSEGIPLVHRDVKPANLVERAEEGDLVLVDASTLRDIDDGTRTRIGTPLYAAPEVVTGRAGPLADVYSFAATAVALLTGARRRELAALLAHPEHLDVPAGLRAALRPDPADRPVSCRAALDPDLPLVVGAEVGWEAPAEADHWLPAATDVLLDPWHDPYTEVADDAPAGTAWPWLALLVAICAAPLAAGLALDVGERAIALVAAVAVHLGACLAARQGLGAALLAPPLAWAGVLGDRSASTRHARAWARAALLPGVVLLAAPGLAHASRVVPLDRLTAVALSGFGLVAVAAVIAIAPDSRALRLALSPLWLLGAGAIVGVGLLLLPFAVLLGRGPETRAALAATARGATAFVRR